MNHDNSSQYERDLRLRLAECEAWCHTLSFPFRTDQLIPPILHQREESNKYDWISNATFTHSVMDTLIQQRKDLLRLRSSCIDPERRSSEGKLLLSAPQAGFLDGAMAAASNDFIDIFDSPPCDTWIDIVQDPSALDFYDAYIVSWVPEAALMLVEQSIRVSFVKNLAWAVDVKSNYVQSLHAAGLI